MRYSIFLLAVLCAFGGCGGSGGQSVSTQSAKLRVILGGEALAGNLTVIIDGTTVATGVNYPTCVNQICQALSGYLTVRAGGVDFAVQAPGSSTNLVPSQFQTLNLSPNTQNTFILGGGMDGEVEGYLFLDDSSPAAGSVKLRIALVDPGALTLETPSVSAWVNSTGSTTGNPNISGVTLGKASSYLTLPPGSYFEVFDISCAGIPPIPFCSKVGPTTFAANQNLTVYLLNEGPFTRPLILADN
jgi:hypothetical protein